MISNLQIYAQIRNHLNLNSLSYIIFDKSGNIDCNIQPLIASRISLYLYNVYMCMSSSFCVLGWKKERNEKKLCKV